MKRMVGMVVLVAGLAACGGGHKTVSLTTYPGNSRVEKQTCVQGGGYRQGKSADGTWYIQDPCAQYRTSAESVMVGYDSDNIMYKCKVDKEFYASFYEGKVYVIPYEQCWLVSPKLGG